MPQVQREWLDKDYYKILGVPQSATETEIRRAYRKLAKANHPDANPGHEDRFKEVSAAYEVLSDTQKRKDYDELRRLGPLAGAGGGAGRDGFGGGIFSFDTEDLGDLFGGLFGRRRPGATATAGQRGDDVEAELHLSFLEALAGLTTTVNVTSEAPCANCHGTGAAPGTSPVVCPRCAGRGVLNDNQGLFSLSRACPECGGRGMIVEKKCGVCHGSGMEVRPRQVKVRIPPGVDDGQRIRLKGRGGAGARGGPPGDLYVTVRVTPHRLFRRKGRDLVVTVPITFAEAALGAEISVPTLEVPTPAGNPGPGGNVVLRIPPGTRSGRTFRVKGRGVNTSKGVGDLLVTVEVAVPTQLSAAERDAIKALADASTESPRAHLGV